MQLFYQPDILPDTSFISFDKEESRHIIKVLRRKLGDDIYITDGKGYLFKGVIESDNLKKCVVKILNKQKKSNLPYHLHLAVAPTKMNDRYEWFLEKATEIGVSEITPIICNHSERNVIKKERLERVLISAMKQSLRTYLPKLNSPISYAYFIENHFLGCKYIAHCEESEKRFLSKELNLEKANSITLLIGPEGDFSTDEIEHAISKGFTAVSLGKSRLRTETAAVVACHTVSLLYDLKDSL